MNRRRAQFPMLVQPIKGEGLVRFFVTSQNTPNTRYLVDLAAYYGNGWCGCAGFAGYIESGKTKNRLGQKLTDVAHPGYSFDDSFRCKHIKAAREYLGREFVNAHLKMVEKLQPNTQV